MKNKEALIKLIQESTQCTYGGEFYDEIIEEEIDINNSEIERIASYLHEQGATILSKSRISTLTKLFNNEWIDTEEVEKALGIDFSTGIQLFDFSRTAVWNPAPLNGQNITTQFRLKNKQEKHNG